ncbi:MAG TPA: YARHG domain-containing protein [Pyrinomonadaceae bacterium]|nr:YARHG domain-containing protein [Pyrinomonadaceae bacterium]
MKRCPTCQSTYTNDALRFCLQDGATLLSVSGTPAFDSGQAAGEETIEISGSSQATGIVDPRAAPTVKSPPAAQTAVEQRRFRGRSTSEEDETGGQPPKSTSIPLVAGITAIIVLLLVLVGLGIALLLRGGTQDGNSNAATQANTDANRKSDNHSAESPSDSNSVSRPRRPDMTGEFTPAAARVEAKILRGQPVTANDIAGLERAELRRLRNTVYARHGRIFERMELQQYFDGRPWYKKRPDYTDEDLNPIDRDNINLIRAAEDRSP